MLYMFKYTGLHRSVTREQVMKHKCYDLEVAFKLLKDQSAKVERDILISIVQSYYEWFFYNCMNEHFSMVGVLGQ